MNEPTETRTNTGAAIASRRSCVACPISTASTRSETARTPAAQGRSRAGHTDHSSVAGASAPGGAEALTSGAGTLGLEVPPREHQLPRGARFVQAPHRSLGRSFLDALRILPGLPVDLEQHVRIGIQGCLRL